MSNDRMIPRGICSRRQHEPLTGNDDGGGAVRLASDVTVRDGDEVVLDVNFTDCIQVTPRLRDQGYAGAPAPERSVLLEDEVTRTIEEWHDRGKAARRILKIERIARGLKLLDDIDSGAVEIICQGSLTRRESSDER